MRRRDTAAVGGGGAMWGVVSGVEKKEGGCA